jgi:predicted permease
MLRLTPSALPRAADVSVNLSVVLFAIIMSALTVLVFGVVPALSSSRVNVNIALKVGSHSATVGNAGRRVRDMLIATQLCMSLVLLTAAVLLMRSFIELERVAPGFDGRNLLTFQMSVPSRYATTSEMWAFERQLFVRFDALPGVDAAASATSLPLDAGPDMPGRLLGQSPPVDINPAYRPVSTGYFHVLGIPLVRGRGFLDSDSPKSQPVAIISASLARQAFPDRDPIGQKLQLGAGLGAEYADAPRVIVGVAGDVRETRLDMPPGITVYVPRSQIPDALTPLMNRVLPVSWAVRTRVPPAQLAAAIRQAILSVDAQQPAADMRTMEQALSISVGRQRFTLLLMTIFATLATLMAAVGIYGVVSYQMRQRDRELGIRLALGAEPRSVVRMVVLQELRPIAGGIAAGTVAALALAKVIRSILFETSPNDPVSLLFSAIALGFLTCACCFLPARRAASIDPMKALRAE